MPRRHVPKVIFKGDQIKALDEILGDYISILEHSYKTGAAALSARQYAIEHSEMIDKKTLEMNPTIIDDLKKEIEQMSNDLPHIEVAISRAMQLKETLKTDVTLSDNTLSDNTLSDNIEGNETTNLQPTGAVQDDTANNQSDAEIPENA